VPKAFSISLSPPAAAVPLLSSLQMPVVASNRIGTETFEHSHITFYGGSFIAGPAGEIVAQVGLRVTTDWGAAGLDPTGLALCGFQVPLLGVLRVSASTGFLLLPVGVQAGARGEQANQGIDPEPKQKEGIITATFDLDECRMNRAG
jgi:hypothetical protein